MSRTKNPPATVKKHIVKVATVEEPSSDDESVLGPAPPSQRELSLVTITDAGSAEKATEDCATHFDGWTGGRNC